MEIRVLYVDDEIEECREFQRAIAAKGLMVDLAVSGTQALHMAARAHYDVVVTNLSLMGMNGLRLIDHIAFNMPDTAFILVSGEEGVPTGEAVDERIASLMSKPFDPDEMARSIARAARLGRSYACCWAPRDPHRRSVLLVDQHFADAADIERHLNGIQTWGHDVTHVVTLSDALNALHDNRFDFVLSDLSLPDAGGLDAVTRIQMAAPDAVVIALSGTTNEEMALRVIRAGAQDFLVKSEVGREQLARALRFAGERKHTERRLSHLAHRDALTGLANRGTFRDRVNHALARSRRDHAPFAIFFLDLDRFKPINDQYGHAAGDAVLKEVATRLEDCVREYDTVARLGGDEFAILVEHGSNKPSAKTVAERIVHAMNAPFSIGNGPADVGVSIGIAQHPADGDSVEALLAHADTAMYLAKRGGGGYETSSYQARNEQRLAAEERPTWRPCRLQTGDTNPQRAET